VTLNILLITFLTQKTSVPFFVFVGNLFLIFSHWENIGTKCQMLSLNKNVIKVLPGHPLNQLFYNHISLFSKSEVTSNGVDFHGHP
jgi:hypothetical protein